MVVGARAPERITSWGRGARSATAVLLAVLVLSACGGGDAGPDPDDPADDGDAQPGDGDAGDDDAGVASLVPIAAPEPPAAVDPVAVVSDTWDAGTIELADGTPVRDWGLTAAPTDGGPYPVVVLLHGSHTICRDDPSGFGTWPCPGDTENPHHEGFTYLAEAIAGRGFVVVAPGVNAQHTFGAGEPAPTTRSSEIADRAVTALEAGERGVDASLVDTGRIIAIGHSVGAQDAALLATGETAFDRAVAGVVLLQPAILAEQALPLVDVPAVTIVGECDGDTGVSGANFVSDALLLTRETPAALLSLAHVTHNAINAGLPPDFFPVETPGCTDDRTMPADEQRELFAAIVPELALAVLGDGGSGWAGIVFDEPATPEGITVGVVPAGAAAAAVPGPSPAILDDLDASGVTVTYRPFGYYTSFVEPDTEPCHRPELPLMVGQPLTLALVWDEPGASITAPLEASTGDILRLRLFPDVADGRVGEGPVRLRLTTDSGATVDVEVAVPPSSFESLDVFDIWHAFLPWQTAAFEVAGDVTSIELTMLEPAEGAIQLLSLGVD